MSKSKFVPLAIIAVLSATAVSQARAEEPLVAGSGRIYYYLAQHPDRDAYTGQNTPASKLSASELLEQQRRDAGLLPNDALHRVAYTRVAAAAQPRRTHFVERAGAKTHAQLLNANAFATAKHHLGRRS